MPTEAFEEDLETLRLPKNWRSSVRHAVLNVIGIVRIAMQCRFLEGSGQTGFQTPFGSVHLHGLVLNCRFDG